MTSSPSPFTRHFGSGILLRMFEALLIVASLALLIADFGQYGSEALRAPVRWFYPVAAAVFVAVGLGRLLRARSREQYAKTYAAELVAVSVMLALAVLVIAGWRYGAAAGRVSGLMKLACHGVIVLVVIRIIRAFQIVSRSVFKPAQLMIVSFAVIIAVGTALLAAPKASGAGRSLSLIDALFTSTSATCVTGLIVKDTGGDFSMFGQSVILALIQLGGLGIMTFTTFFALALGKGMGLRESRVMSDVLNAPTARQVARLVVYIFVFTAILEALGAVGFYAAFGPGYDAPNAGRLWSSIFHSVSAFCNAGFSLHGTSFMRWGAQAGVAALLAALIIIGGLGFTVNGNLLSVLARRIRPRPRPGLITRQSGREIPRLSLQTKIVLVTSAALIAAGALALLLVDHTGAISRTHGAEKALAACFQSVTARTAGFNTVNIGQLDPASKLVLMILMFIGASPGSTGGGIKTVTFAVLLMGVFATARGETVVQVFRRTIPRAIVAKALAVILISLAFIAVATLVLCVTEAGSGMDFQSILFEVVSAFGTVGLSTGITSTLTSLGKAVIIATMFVGRLGPLTMVLAMGERARRLGYQYPEEKGMIG